MKKYGTYVRRNVPFSAFGRHHLNGWYDLSFFLSYPEYSHPGIISVRDGEIVG